jgi:8-oxo-dGTP diphosphatase
MIFSTPPTDFKPKLEVSACFIEHGNQVLFLHRLDTIPQGGTWAIPGGKIHAGETPLQAIIRETQEEAAVTLTNPEFIQKVYIRYPEYDYVYHMFRAVVTTKPQITLDPKESQDYQWLTREQANALEAQNKLILDEMPCIEVVYGASEFGILENVTT